MKNKNKYKYTKNWFIYSEIKNNIFKFVSKISKNNVLEIGCFEGLSSVFFADNILEHPESTLTCVDPFLSLEDNDHKMYLEVDFKNIIEKNFDYNISICKNKEKIEVNKITSDDFFKNNTKYFNFIYIDGCHLCDFIKRDMENSFKFLEINGIMWMDDYGFDIYANHDDNRIKNTMDSFLEKYKGKYELIHKGYQLAIKKIGN